MFCVSEGALYCLQWGLSDTSSPESLLLGSGLVLASGVLGWGFGSLARFIQMIRSN